MTSRQQQALLTKEKIYVQAVALINEKGYENVLIEDITKSAALAKGTFYYYFKSKEQLLYYTYQYLNQYYERAFQKAARRTSFLEMMETFVLESYGKLESLGKELLRAVCCNLYRGEIKDIFFDKKRTFWKALEYFVRAGLRNGDISSRHTVDYYVEKIAILLVGLDNYWVLSDQAHGLPQLAWESVHTLIKGFAEA